MVGHDRQRVEVVQHYPLNHVLHRLFCSLIERLQLCLLENYLWLEASSLQNLILLQHRRVRINCLASHGGVSRLRGRHRSHHFSIILMSLDSCTSFFRVVTLSILLLKWAHIRRDVPLSGHDSRRDISLGRANHRWRGECKNTGLVSLICLRVLLTADYVYHDGWVLYFIASWQNLCSDIHNALIHLHFVNILSNNSLFVLTTISDHRTWLPDRLIVPIIRCLLRQLNCKLINALSCLSLHKVC